MKRGDTESGPRKMGFGDWLTCCLVSKEDTILNGIWVWLALGKCGGLTADDFTEGNLGKCLGTREGTKVHHEGAKIQTFKKIWRQQFLQGPQSWLVNATLN